jgi:hypothetical protein
LSSFNSNLILSKQIPTHNVRNSSNHLEQEDKSELEGLFIDCVKEVKKDINMKRRNQNNLNKQTNSSNSSSGIIGGLRS